MTDAPWMPARRGRLLLPAMVAALLVTLPQPEAGAQALKDQAQHQWKEGTTEYALGHYAQAIDHFEQGYRLLRDPIFVFNIAQAYRLAGAHEQALLAYRSYLRVAAHDAPKRDVAARWIGELETPHAPVAATAEPRAATDISRPSLSLREVDPPANLLDRASPPPRPQARHHWWWWGAAGAVVATSVAAVALVGRHGDGLQTGSVGIVTLR
jgi:tetratricopeptide (TPR) repeat protein